jgi:hypothetical protein
MDCLFEILLPLLGEFAIGSGFELLAEGIGRLIYGLLRVLGALSELGVDLGTSATSPRDDSPAAKARRANVGRVLLWGLGGVASGAISLLVLPHPMVKVPILHAINLILTPLAMAAAMVYVGRLFAREGPTRPRRSTGVHFACAYAFALAHLLVRFSFAH